MEKEKINIFDYVEEKKNTRQVKLQIKKAKEIAVGKIITLCGPTVNKYEYKQVNMILTLAGNVVLSCGVFRNDFAEIEKHRELLEVIHKKKIDMSQIVFVINVNGFIGKHTSEEIEYAKKTGKTILYLYNEKGVKML